MINSAPFKRAEQLRRWEESETNREPCEIKKGNSRRVQFSSSCVFLAACAAGEKEEVLRLLEHGADIDTANVDGLTALHQACIDDNLDMVEFLVKHGADVNRGDNEGWTPLHATASCGFLSIAQYLIEQGADVAAVNNDGDLPIDIAERDEMEDLLKHEINQKGINCDDARNQEHKRMLQDAKDWVAGLNNDNIDKLHYKTGATALHVAAAKGYTDVLSVLLKSDLLNVDPVDIDGWTPLHAAAHWGQREAAKLLVENFANMNTKNFVGQTPFDVADPDMLKYLEELRELESSLNRDVLLGKRQARRKLNDLPAKIKKMGEGDFESKNVNDDAVEMLDYFSSSTTSSSESESSSSISELNSPVEIDVEKHINAAVVETGTVDEKTNTQPSSPVATVTPQPPVSPVTPTSPTTSPTTETKLISDKIESENSDELGSIPTWRRPNSFKTRLSSDSNIVTSIKSPDIKTPTRSQVDPEVVLRRTHSFENDEKFKSRYLELQARIKASSFPPVENAANNSISNRHYNNYDDYQNNFINRTEKSSDASLSIDESASSQSKINDRESSDKHETNEKNDSDIKNTTNLIGLIGSASAANNFNSALTNLKSPTAEDANGNKSIASNRITQSMLTRSTSLRTDRWLTSRLSSKSSKESLLRLETNENIASPPTENSNVSTTSNISKQNVESPNLSSSAIPVRRTLSGNLPPLNVAAVTVASSQPTTPTSTTSSGISKLSPGNIFKNFFKSFVPPVRDEESETQRKAHAKRVRETRRSTQGVTLDEIKSAEQLVKRKNLPSGLSYQNNNSDQTAVVNGSSDQEKNQGDASPTVTATITAINGNGDNKVDNSQKLGEKRPSWRLRVDNGSKFKLEDANAAVTSSGTPTVYVRRTPTTTLPPTRPVSEPIGNESAITLSLRRSSKALEDKEQDKENDIRNAQATQAVIQRRRRPKRRSTGVVQVDMDEIDPDKQENTGSGDFDDVSKTSQESGSENAPSLKSRIDASSNLSLNSETPNENGEVDYKKLWEQSQLENKRLRTKLKTTEDDLQNAQQTLERISNATSGKNSLSELEKREKRAMERKLSEMEEELKQLQKFKAENERLRAENRALTRVVSKLTNSVSK